MGRFINKIREFVWPTKTKEPDWSIYLPTCPVHPDKRVRWYRSHDGATCQYQCEDCRTQYLVWPSDGAP